MDLDSTPANLLLFGLTLIDHATLRLILLIARQAFDESGRGFDASKVSAFSVQDLDRPASSDFTSTA